MKKINAREHISTFGFFQAVSHATNLFLQYNAGKIELDWLCVKILVFDWFREMFYITCYFWHVTSKKMCLLTPFGFILFCYVMCQYNIVRMVVVVGSPFLNKSFVTVVRYPLLDKVNSYGSALPYIKYIGRSRQRNCWVLMVSSLMSIRVALFSKIIFKIVTPKNYEFSRNYPFEAYFFWYLVVLGHFRGHFLENHASILFCRFEIHSNVHDIQFT